MVPKPLTAPGSTTGRYDRRDFKYIAEDDEYECPAGERAIYQGGKPLNIPMQH